MRDKHRYPEFYLAYSYRCVVKCHNSISSCLLLLLILLLGSCAQIVKPTGGPPDKRPPHAISYKPDSAAVFFKSKKIEIVFDEYIQLKDLNSQLLVSPPMERSPEVKVKGKSLEIVLRSPLKDSTTYTISMGTSVADLHESNAIPDFKYVFSTGSYVDSLTVSGTVINAFSKLPEKGIMVMFYNKSDDSLPYKSMPAYFGRTDVAGTYQISHMKAGNYKIFALRDQNGNYKYNSGEMIGFRDQELSLAESRSNIDMVLFKEELLTQKFRKASQIGYGRIMLTFALPENNLHLKALRPGSESAGPVFYEKSKKGDTITYWFVPQITDSIFLEVSDNNKIYDTLRYKLISKEKMLSQHRGDNYLLKLQNNISPLHPFDLNDPVRLTFSAPVPAGILDPGKIHLTEDTLRANLFSKAITGFADSAKRVLTIKSGKEGWKESKRYHLLVLPGAFKDMYGFINDTMRAGFKTAELRYYGTLKLTVNAPEGHYVLQLLDDKDLIVKEEYFDHKKEFYFDYLQPMNYRLRLIFDTNNNKKWDTGNYHNKTQPEKVIYYKEPVTIRSNWDQETVWIINP